MLKLFTGVSLFVVDDSGDVTETDDDHLLQLNDILGPLSPLIMLQWLRAATYFITDGQKIKSYVGNPPPDGDDLNSRSSSIAQGNS